jgi:uncharacterized protein (DUF1778 family)
MQFQTEIAIASFPQGKIQRVDAKASAQTLTLLQNAAQASSRNISEFILDAAISAAHEILA